MSRLTDQQVLSRMIALTLLASETPKTTGEMTKPYGEYIFNFMKAREYFLPTGHKGKAVLWVTRKDLRISEGWLKRRYEVLASECREYVQQSILQTNTKHRKKKQKAQPAVPDMFSQQPEPEPVAETQTRQEETPSRPSVIPDIPKAISLVKRRFELCDDIHNLHKKEEELASQKREVSTALGDNTEELNRMFKRTDGIAVYHPTGSKDCLVVDFESRKFHQVPFINV